MTWKELVRNLIFEYCNTQGNRTFTLREFQSAHAADFARFAPDNRHPEAKVRQVFQQLRADELLTFVDNHGTYTLRGVELLKDEVENPEILAASSSANEREYLKEVHARYRGWVKIARLTYGDFCLMPDCRNTFLKDDGQPYAEVHHIDALCEGGEEAIWNLAVVCAHHHRMAHFALMSQRAQLRHTLIQSTQARLRHPASHRVLD